MKVRPEVAHVSVVQYGRKLIDVPVDEGLPSPEEIKEELDGYWEVMFGREPSPVHSPYLDLQEVATAYFARACEIEALILWEEQNNRIPRGHPLYKIRTGYVRSFKEAAKAVVDLGSRRLTQEVLLHEQRYDSGDR